MMKKHLLIVLSISVLLFIVFVRPVVQNQKYTTYEELSEMDQAVLTELNDYMSIEQKKNGMEGVPII